MDSQFKKSSLTPISRNYMKQTSCSDARKGQLQVTVTSPVFADRKKSLGSSKNSNSFKVSSCFFTVSSSPTSVGVVNKQPSLKPWRSSMKKSSKDGLCAKKDLSRATCSSTLKNSKFPAVLVLDHGATEAEGTSKMRVCPYAYCSLNGHLHEGFPPLKSFVSARRKLLETQRNMKTEDLCSAKISKNEEEKIDEKQINDITRTSSDLSVDIYSMPQEEIILENCNVDSSETMSQMNELSDISLEFDYDMDQTGECSQDEMDDVMMNFLEYVEIDNERKSPEDDKFEQCIEMKISDTKSTDMDWEDQSIRSSSVLNSESIVNFDPKLKEEGFETISVQTSEHNDNFDYPKTSPKANFHQLEDQSNKVEKVDIDLRETGGILSSKWSISRKRTVEEVEEGKEFNPKSPNFLQLEPDPEAEKVDLRHQMMDGRKNSEEWMLDYALQQAVSKLGGHARKRKVALLVKAFETVVPMNIFEKPLDHGTSSSSSSFSHLSFIQACN